MKIFWQKKYNILLLLDMDVIIDLFYHHGDNLNKNITVTTMFAAWQAAVNRLQSNFQITAAGVLSAQHCSRLINEMPVVHLYKNDWATNGSNIKWGELYLHQLSGSYATEITCCNCAKKNKCKHLISL